MRTCSTAVWNVFEIRLELALTGPYKVCYAALKSSRQHPASQWQCHDLGSTDYSSERDTATPW